MLIVVKKNKNVHFHNSPLVHREVDKDALPFYIYIQGERNVNLHFIYYLLSFVKGSYKVKRSASYNSLTHFNTESILYFRARWVCTDHKSDTANSLNEILQIPEKVLIQTPCSDYSITISKEQYHTIQWHGLSLESIISLEIERCMHWQAFKVLFFVLIGDESILVPNTTHDVQIYRNRIFSPESNTALLTLKISHTTFFTSTSTSQKCSLKLRYYASRIQVHHPMEVQPVELPNDLIKLGVERGFYRGNHKHFVFTRHNKTNWLTANRFCKDLLNATAFVYFSQQELSEVFHALADKPRIVFTGFRVINQVK